MFKVASQTRHIRDRNRYISIYISKQYFFIILAFEGHRSLKRNTDKIHYENLQISVSLIFVESVDPKDYRMITAFIYITNGTGHRFHHTIYTF